MICVVAAVTVADKFSLFLQCFYGFFAVGLLLFGKGHRPSSYCSVSVAVSADCSDWAILEVRAGKARSVKDQEAGLTTESLKLRLAHFPRLHTVTFMTFHRSHE